ncbi:dentin sialophosphoprotein-like isoform X2 [Chenopodium quinoa]|uniref:dentin sialophosphoprotein-like isoform X2 n=1 Tax=Chenopodium quinoa TaxID=63459 RepID=UPI000B78EE56|nr:dentin sialophosphoprotein-like isoform X2 [Chenopodium quinoa]
MNASEIDLDSPAIKALGSLFKLTEVFLLDDGFPIDDNRQVSSCPKHIRFKYDDDDDDDDHGGKISSKSSIETLESVVMEDVDISLEMSALGLPLTFQTSKHPSSVQSKEKHKLVQRKDQDSQNRLKERILLSPNPNAESQTYAEFQDTSSSSSSLSMPDQAELSCSGFDVFDDTVRLSNSSDGEQPATVADVPRNMSCEVLIEDLLETDFQMENNISIAATSNLLERNTSCGRNIFNDCIIEHPKEIDRSLMERVDAKGDQLGNAMQLDDLGSSMCIEQTQVAGMPLDSDMVLDNNANSNFSSSTVSGEWNAFWDSFYMRYYFYNSKTEESTWYPPPGMESFVYGDVSNTCDESNTEAIGAVVDPAFSQNEEQLDRHELDDKVRFDERTEDKVFGVQAFTTQDLSSSSVMLSDKSYAVKLYDHRVLDGNYQTAITSSSSLSTINPYQNPENEREQEGSGGMSTSVSQSNNYDSVDSPCENANGDCSGNLIAQLSNSSSLSSVDEAAVCDDNLINHAPIRKLEKEANGLPAATKQKTKRRNRRRKKSFNNNDDHEFQPAEEYYVDITKYWCQRYLLFSKFDVGIQMDEEGWFSVTPEAIARHHASRSGGGVVIDCFTGVGGNAIQFAKTSKHVIAIDIDPKKIDYAHHNASIYGVEGRIDFINGDSFSVAPTLKADTVFLSPPWGGPDYLKVQSYDISMLQPHDGQYLFNTFKATASLIIMFLPRNVDIVQLAELSLSSNTPWSLEVEKNYLNGKLKAVTAYFSKSS